jgi:hypothetical protein
MLLDQGIDPLIFTERAILDQALRATADIALGPVTVAGDVLTAGVTVTNKTGHKFPSGVGFRRAFLHVAVVDPQGKALWESGRTDESGVIVDSAGKPIDGELWWKADCAGRVTPSVFQPHYQEIDREDQAQIYQELATAPSDGGAPRCGHEESSPTPGFPIPLPMSLPAEGAPAAGGLTTSFLSICHVVKDNRLLPHGFLKLPQRVEIARALGAGPELARESGSTAVDGDPDYDSGGSDSLLYRIDLSRLHGEPAAVEATLYYQAIPPFYLQDRFCTPDTQDDTDTRRLYVLAGYLNLGAVAEHWKLEVAATKRASIP